MKDQSQECVDDKEPDHEESLQPAATAPAALERPPGLEPLVVEDTVLPGTTSFTPPYAKQLTAGTVTKDVVGHRHTLQQKMR